jgi:transposase
MLNVTEVRHEIHTENLLVVGVDVSKDKLNLYAEHTEPTDNRRYEIDDQIRNRTAAIEGALEELAGYAEKKGLEGLLVICEPTGGYEETLLQTARRLGHETAYVNGEHVANASLIESGDQGKTDQKDARVIAMVAEMDKTQEQRVLKGEHALLRELGRMYEAEDQAIVRARNRIHDFLGKLFCDYDKRNEFVFETSGAAVAELYGWNPHKIVEDGFDRFRQKMKQKVKGVHESTLEQLWDQAKSSTRRQMPSAQREVLEGRLRQLWADFKRHEARKEEIATRMGTLFEQLSRRGEAPDRIDGIDKALMGRLIAESGPLSDFDHWREVLHYCGLNLYERESGKFKGETKISKKGRSRLRKVLSQAAFALAQGKGPFAEYYQRKRAEGMGHWRTIVAIMRKLCKILYGLYKSGRPYDPERVFTCESQYTAAG